MARAARTAGADDAATSATADLTYEQAREELADVVARLEAGGLSLEESLALWERGESLAATCEGFLAAARARIDAVEAATQQDAD